MVLYMTQHNLSATSLSPHPNTGLDNSRPGGEQRDPIHSSGRGYAVSSKDHDWITILYFGSISSVASIFFVVKTSNRISYLRVIFAVQANYLIMSLCPCL